MEASARQDGCKWVGAGDPDGVALVAIHTYHREAERYARIAPLLPGRRILSSLPPTDEQCSTVRRVEHWVDHHLEVLDAMPIGGPVRLVGWSFGGVVAVELARRLRAEGREVAYCGLIDTLRPTLRPLSTREYLWFHLGEAVSMPDERARLPYLRRKTLFLAHRKFPRTGAVVIKGLTRAGFRRNVEVIERPSKPSDPLAIAIHAAYLNYRGDGVDFPVHLYETEMSAARAVRPALNWAGQLHQGFTLTRVEGDHASLFAAEHVASVAAAMRSDLDRA